MCENSIFGIPVVAYRQTHEDLEAMMFPGRCEAEGAVHFITREARVKYMG